MPDVIAIIEAPATPVAVTEVVETAAVQVVGTEVVTVQEGPQGPRGIDTNINKLTASTVAPADPQVNDLWIDIS